MAKLIYLYIKSINRKIKDQEMNFSDDFKVSYSNEKLKIQKNEKRRNFWGENIENFTLLIGKNGVGKTSVLDLIGTNEKTKKINFGNSQYFMIYHITEDIFYFEGTMSRRILNIGEAREDKKFFFFKASSEEIFQVEPNDNQSKINLYYSRNKIAIPWAGDKKKSKTNLNKNLRYYDIHAKFEDALIAFSKLNLFENTNRAFKIEQKMNYSNNPRYLSYLYEFDNHDLSLMSPHKLFLNEEGIIKNNEIYKYYTRSFQDKIYDTDEHRKKYFIVRILEKIFLQKISLFVDLEFKKNERDLKYEFLNGMYKIKKRYSYENINEFSTLENLNSRIEFLKEILMYFKAEFESNSINIRVKNIEQVIAEIDSIPSEYFKDKNFILIPSEDMNLTKTINNIQEVYSEAFSIKFTNFSDGELIYLNLFSNIYKYLRHSKEEDCILLLDEPDINLHPEWSRRLIYDLVNLIITYKKTGNVQVIIATHSPFIVTDFPKENIYAFKLDENKKTTSYLIKNPQFGFAANIYDLITDTFFMDASIGEFAISKIREAQNSKNNNFIKEVVGEIDDVFLKNLMKKELEKND